MAKKIKTVAGTDGYEYPVTSYELVLDENGESLKTKLAQLSGGSGATTASGVSITDTANNFAATDVEGALAELFQFVSNGKSLIASAITSSATNMLDGSNPSLGGKSTITPYASL